MTLKVLAALVGAALGALLTQVLGKTGGQNVFWKDPITMGVIGGVVGFGVVSLVAGNKVEWTPAVAQVETREALDTVLASAGDEPVLVDFYATWCPPCRATAPNLNQVAAEGHRVAVVDVDRASDLAQEYSIEGVPTLLVFRNKRQVDRQVGYHSVAELTQLVVAQRR